jgi:maltose O-acetyltransferase
MSRYSRKCAALGAGTLISPSDISGRLERLRIGSDCTIGRVQIQLHAEVTIGNCVVINDGCRLLTGTHDIHSPHWELIAKPIVVEDFAWIAMGATVLPGVTIGRGAVVGAAAVVTKSVAPLNIVVGNPANVVGERAAADFSYCPSRFNALFESWLGPIQPEQDARLANTSTAERAVGAS